MSKSKHRPDAPDTNMRQRDWRRLHHSPLFWIGAFLFIAAALLYLL